MTHKSSLKGFIRVPTTMADADKPISTGRYRFLADNALHMGDQCGRVLCAAQWPSGLSPRVAATGEYTKIISLGPYRLTVDADGKAYPIRIRIAGARDAKLGTVDFRIVLRPVGSPAIYGTNEVNATMSSATSSLTPAWLTTTSTLLSLTPAQTSLALAEDTASDDGSSRVSVVTYKATIDIFGRNTALTAESSLTAFYAAEYVGV